MTWGSGEPSRTARMNPPLTPAAQRCSSRLGTRAARRSAKPGTWFEYVSLRSPMSRTMRTTGRLLQKFAPCSARISRIFMLVAPRLPRV